MSVGKAFATAAALTVLSPASAFACSYEKAERTTAEATPAPAPQPVAALPATPAPVAAAPVETQTAAMPIATPGQPKTN